MIWTKLKVMKNAKRVFNPVNQKSEFIGDEDEVANNK